MIMSMVDEFLTRSIQAAIVLISWCGTVPKFPIHNEERYSSTPFLMLLVVGQSKRDIELNKVLINVDFFAIVS